MNTVIKNLFADSSEKELHEIIDILWSEYTNFNQDIDTFESNDFI